MPLPLPDLDTRRWSDLLEEARALLPRTAPGWTDYNASDPGITVLELLAWYVEQDLFRANRVASASRRAFLALAGAEPHPAEPARLIVAAVASASGGAPLHLPAGTTLSVLQAGRTVEVETQADLTAALSAPTVLLDLGDEPRVGSTVSFGFDGPLPPATTGSLALTCAGSSSTATDVELAWEMSCAAPTGWRRLDPEANEVEDGTRKLSTSGLLRFRPPVEWTSLQLPGSPDSRFYLRARVVSGRYDATPSVSAVEPNAVPAVQLRRYSSNVDVAAGTTPVDLPAAGVAAMLQELTLDPAGRVTAVSFTPAPGSGSAPDAARRPEVRVLSWAPSTPTAAGVLELDLLLARGTGAPDQGLLLPDRPVLPETLVVWTRTDDGAEPAWRSWSKVPDLAGAGRSTPAFVVDPTAGLLRFGDGEHGLVPPTGAVIVICGASTLGSGGALTPGTVLSTGSLPAGRLRVVSLPSAGRDAESEQSARARAVSAAHGAETLVELTGGLETLDQADRTAVHAVPPPDRACTSLDVERLALDVGAGAISRARAWAGLDLDHPGLSAPGTVSLVVLSALPAVAPQPSPGLLRVVRRELHQRSVAGTRLVVRGPRYREVTVTATAVARTGADPKRIGPAVTAALRAFLDPLAGGPLGRGWPFGRSVFRTELLTVVDGVPGVDYVAALELSVDGSAASCADVCLQPADLVRSGPHVVTVVDAGAGGGGGGG